MKLSLLSSRSSHSQNTALAYNAPSAKIHYANLTYLHYFNSNSKIHSTDALRPRDHITVALQTVHWLPVGQRITYKLYKLMHGVAFGYAPSYLLHAAVQLSTLPGRAHLRSADNGQYDVPRVSSSVGSRAFSVAGPRAWNPLPMSLRQMDCVETFKRNLKAKLFMNAFCESK